MVFCFFIVLSVSHPFSKHNDVKYLKALFFFFLKVVQSCLTLCDSMNYTVHGILQARILEWVAFPFSRGSSQPRDQTQVSHIAGGKPILWLTFDNSNNCGLDPVLLYFLLFLLNRLIHKTSEGPKETIHHLLLIGMKLNLLTKRIC